jgi:adenylate cyclase
MRILAQLRRGVIYLLPMTLLLVAIGARVVAPDLLDRLSLIAFDFYQRAAPRQPGNAPIRIINIDDKSLKKIGQWPWPRTIVAQMIDRLAAAGAAVIAFDIDFAELDRTWPKLLLPLITQNGAGLADAEKLLRVLPDPDQALAASVKKIPVATGFILTDSGETRPPAEKAGFAMNGTDPLAIPKASPRWCQTCRCWKPPPPATGFSTNISTGITSCAARR